MSLYKKPPPTPATGLKKVAFIVLAYLSLGCAILGLFIPGLPSTEFVLLSAWAAARSSPRLSNWLENHRVFGPLLHNWRNGGVITRKSKAFASLSMLACLGLLIWHSPPLWLMALAAGGMAIGAAWIWSRPEHIGCDEELPALGDK
ncbi:YbaN family protein [Pseudomonas sp. ABC1]|uniref:YbaN family protein n=1 Tax=Pseudomonas sp. ABC1 TaxID=2748080 RepID=UPI0015C38B71|nr:YbaN family protein [Pseudomonas sp. ABC1]QLF94364.1 YbaN family protein [Pseudomonas sp. ABC1]